MASTPTAGAKFAGKASRRDKDTQKPPLTAGRTACKSSHFAEFLLKPLSFSDFSMFF